MNPEKLTSQDAGFLETILQRYPYFQNARALQLKILKNEKSYRFNDALKVSAAHTTNRDILFEYITSEKFIQNEISQNILNLQKDKKEIEVQAEDISKQVTQEENEKFNSEKRKAETILNPDLFIKKQQSESDANKEEQIESEIPEQDKPLEFTENDTYSFSEWLKLASARPIKRKEEIDNKNDRPDNSMNKKLSLIDKFIQNQPKIRPNNNTEKENSKIISKQISAYSQAPDSLMTETLAKVYLQQKNYKKAIQAYKILILKNPEKSGYFADQIRAIEKIINPEQS